eukprot:2127354-Alexandrium_andersonii.AAC.1
MQDHRQELPGLHSLGPQTRKLLVNPVFVADHLQSKSGDPTAGTSLGIQGLDPVPKPRNPRLHSAPPTRVEQEH